MAKTRTQPKIPKFAPPAVDLVVKIFDISTRFMAPSLDVPIMDTLLDRDRDTGMRVRIKSPQSVEARDAARAYRATLPPSDAPMTPAQVDGVWLAQLVAATESWSGFVNQGEDVPCTPENIRALYENTQAMWIYAQVFGAFLDASRFFGSPRSS
jgi:hypothetical protein